MIGGVDGVMVVVMVGVDGVGVDGVEVGGGEGVKSSVSG